MLLADKENRVGVYPITIGSDLKEMRYRLENIHTNILKMINHLEHANYLDQ